MLSNNCLWQMHSLVANSIRFVKQSTDQTVACWTCRWWQTPLDLWNNPQTKQLFIGRDATQLHFFHAKQLSHFANTVGIEASGTPNQEAVQSNWTRTTHTHTHKIDAAVSNDEQSHFACVDWVIQQSQVNNEFTCRVQQMSSHSTTTTVLAVRCSWQEAAQHSWARTTHTHTHKDKVGKQQRTWKLAKRGGEVKGQI